MNKITIENAGINPAMEKISPKSHNLVKKQANQHKKQCPNHKQKQYQQDGQKGKYYGYGQHARQNN